MGAGIGYALLLTTGSNVLALVMTAPIALLVNNFVRICSGKARSDPDLGRLCRCCFKLLDDATATVTCYGEMNVYCGLTRRRFCRRVAFSPRASCPSRLVSLGPLVGIFAPTGAWDDGVGTAGMDLANKVMTVLDQIEWSRRTNQCT